MSNLVECAICGSEVENIEDRNGEMQCEECYEDPINDIFKGDEA